MADISKFKVGDEVIVFFRGLVGEHSIGRGMISLDMDKDKEGVAWFKVSVYGEGAMYFPEDRMLPIDCSDADLSNKVRKVTEKNEN